MTITSKDFIINPSATNQDIKNLNLSLIYLENSQTALTILNTLKDMTVNPLYPSTPLKIFINHNQLNQYDPGTNILNWDPNTELVVVSDNSVTLGVQSAALAFIHEAAHATDSDPQSYQNIPNRKYDNNGEMYAVGKENLVALDLGVISGNSETLRFNHLGANAYDDNPTDHTVQNSNGTYSWQEEVLDGRVTVKSGSYQPGANMLNFPFIIVPTPTNPKNKVFIAPTTPHNLALIQDHTISVDKATIGIASNEVLVVGSGNTINLNNSLHIQINGSDTIQTTADRLITNKVSGIVNVSSDAVGKLKLAFNQNSADNALDYFVPNSGSSVVTIDCTAAEASALDPPPGAYTFTAYVSALSDQPQQVTINMTQGDATGFEVDTGNGLIPFSNGTVTLTITPGQDSVTFGLVNIKPVTQAARASSQKGDLISVGSGNNTIFSSTANDAIFMGSGNNLVVLGAGNDTVYGGDTVIHISQISCQLAACLGC